MNKTLFLAGSKLARRRFVALATLATLGAMPLATHAGEGGASLYMQGTYNDFAMAAWGPSGFYMRDDILFYTASIGPRPLGGKIAASVDQDIWVNALKLSYVSDWKILGGTYGAAVALPVVINANVSGAVTTAGFSRFAEGDTAGLADVFLLPFQLNWVFGNHHVTFAPGVFAPTGGYDKDRLLNTGRNYWALDATVSYTWLHPQRGHEISLTAGYLINTENPDTDYRTGNEFHLDWMVAQHFSERFALGLTGYWYQQVGKDSGSVAGGNFDVTGFEGFGVGLGPAVMYAANILGKDVTIIGKWIHDLDTKNRFEGDLAMLSVALKF